MESPWNAQCSHPGKAFPALSLQLPWELLQFGEHQSPIPAWEGETKRGPALVSESSIDGVHPHLVLPGAGIILSAALTKPQQRSL